jgi:hypothetical protein
MMQERESQQRDGCSQHKTTQNHDASRAFPV